jgi:hypothetical protein
VKTPPSPEVAIARARARADWLRIMRDLRIHADELARDGKPAAEQAARALVARAWRELHRLRKL